MDRPFKPKYGTVSQVLLQLVAALNLEYINGNRTATDVQVNLYGGYECTDISDESIRKQRKV